MISISKLVNKIIAFSILTVLFISFPFVANAQLNSDTPLDLENASSRIVISPPTFELNANPGDTIENTIKITNLSATPRSFVTSTRNFTAVGEEGAVGLTEEENSFSLASWMRLLPVSAEIPAGETKTFTFVMDIPENAEPGGHFGSVVFTAGSEEKLDQPGATVAQEVASLVLVKIAGDVDEQADIESFNTESSFYEYGPVNFDIRVKNDGNVHVKPTGNITITNMLGQQVASFAIDPKNVLPDAVRRVPATWNQKYMFGRYTATAVLNYGSEGSTMVASTSFTGLPYKVVGAASLGLLVVLAMLLKGRKRIGKAFKVLFSG